MSFATQWKERSAAGVSEMGLGAAAIIQAGSGFLYVLLGLTILVFGWRRAALAALGIGLASFGATFVVANVLVNNQAALDSAVVANGFLYVASAVGLAIFALRHPRPLAPAVRRPFLAIAAVAIGASIWGSLHLPDAFGHTYYGNAPPGIVKLNLAAFAALYSIFALLIAVGAVRARSSSKREAAGYALVAIGVGTYVAFNSAATFTPTRDWDPTIILLAWGTPLAMILVSGGVWAHQLRGEASHLGRNVLLALSAAALLGSIEPIFHAPGEIGIIRILGAALVAIAVFKYDLLGIELPRATITRGPVATGALATLFIVAQIAQNFLAAQYGLILGGIVAGAFLFMASPIQRAMERFSTAREPRSAPAGPSTLPNARAEDLYRENLRMVLKDQRITAEEEQHLAELGEHLGISARRAVELRHEIEREKGVR